MIDLVKEERDFQMMKDFPFVFQKSYEYFCLESSGVYGCRKITKDMKVLDEICGRNRILRLMKAGCSWRLF